MSTSINKSTTIKARPIRKAGERAPCCRSKIPVKVTNADNISAVFWVIHGVQLANWWVSTYPQESRSNRSEARAKKASAADVQVMVISAAGILK
jgi:hypothetical protein